MNKDIPKVYLDTNIIIGGSKRPEHKKLINLALKGLVKLSIGDEVSMEIRKRIFNLRREKDKLFKEEKLYSQEQFMEELNRITNEIKGAEEQTKIELNFWREVKPERVKNTFRGVMFILEFEGEHKALRYDTKNEISLLIELIKVFKIGTEDAFHIMQAHSANMDILLTWDEKQLINRAKRVPWLKPEVMTPKDFIKKFQQ